MHEADFGLPVNHDTLQDFGLKSWAQVADFGLHGFFPVIPC